MRLPINTQSLTTCWYLIRTSGKKGRQCAHLDIDRQAPSALQACLQGSERSDQAALVILCVRSTVSKGTYPACVRPPH